MLFFISTFMYSRAESQQTAAGCERAFSYGHLICDTSEDCQQEWHMEGLYIRDTDREYILYPFRYWDHCIRAAPGRSWVDFPRA